MLFSSALWAEEELRPADFAGAMVFSGREGSLLYLEIPQEVYQGFRRPDLGDLRIFDASENPVSFYIRERPKEFFTPAPEEIPFFVWDGGKESNLPANTDIEINTSGGVVRIKNSSATAGSPSVFLADLSRLKYLPEALRVQIDDRGNNFNIPVTIHYSGDLSNWSSFDKRQVLASFGSSARNTLELPEADDIKSLRYLLISFAWQAPTPKTMTALFKPQEKPAVSHEAVFRGVKSGDGKRVTYNTEAFYPIESVDFILEDADSIPVLIKNRLSEDEEWRVRRRGTLFRYNSAQADGIAKSEPFEISSSAPLWELEASGGLPFSAAPELVIRWQPRELIFPARGKGPWTLAYGNSGCEPISSGELSGSDEPEAAVFTGEKRYEKTELTLPEIERDYHRYFLWAFLGAAVLILTILAFYIAKSIRK